MLDKTTRLVSENLARALNRRTFLKRAGETTFAGVIALAAGRGVPAFAAGVRGGGERDTKPPAPAVPQCAPPGPYCNTTGTILSGCHGASCFEHLYNNQVLQCRVYYTYYQAGCWTTASGGGYWTCCDCECLSNGQRQTTCGCAQFSTTPAPRPDNPAGHATVRRG
jgi:hypothetical protein